jgi:hypothetical protein
MDIGIVLLRTVSSGIFGDRPCLDRTALRKLGMARLDKAYSGGV